MRELRHYAVCDCCRHEARVRGPGALPSGWRKMTEPHAGTPLQLCEACSARVLYLLEQLGWQPPKGAHDAA